jgi:hypothetical protein
MFRALGFVLAIVLCNTGWSTAHAAPKPQLVESLAKTIKGGWLYKDRTIHFNEPFKADLPLKGTYEKDKINIPSLRDVAGFLGWPSFLPLTSHGKIGRSSIPAMTIRMLNAIERIESSRVVISG